MSALALSVLLCLISALAYAGGAIVQERVAVSTPDRPYAPLRRPAWWTAVGLNGLGALLHVAALAYGPLSLVQPLGALTIVFALPLAALFVHRRAGRTAWRGALMATAGLAGLLALTGRAVNSDPLDAGERGLLVPVTAGAVAVLWAASHLVRRPAQRSVLLAAAAGTAFGIASVFTKSVATGWTAAAPVAQYGEMLVIAGLATSGLLLSQASYRGAGLTAPLATVTVVNPVVAAVVGLTLFGESFRGGPAGAAGAVVFAMLTAAGVVLLMTERHAAEVAESESISSGRAGDGMPSAAPAGRVVVSSGARRESAPSSVSAAPAASVASAARVAASASASASASTARVAAAVASDGDAAVAQVRERVDV
ncbi:DMT family transporter [Streptomyces sp. NPDC101118]|uniref:DMT family transporter n=1 Tax=Streptomyces sp. NPDC101118 TaxID=3366109 RepID=UPI00382ECA40